VANALYDLGRESFLKGEISWNTNNIKAVLVDTGLYTPNLTTDQFLSAIAAGARVATSANLTGKTTAAGVADADDVTFTAVTGASIEAVVLYQDTGSATTSRLIGYIDTATGLPVTPSGGDITVVWDSGANRIFKL
jgi:phage tail sheath gpL-like